MATSTIVFPYDHVSKFIENCAWSGFSPFDDFSSIGRAGMRMYVKEVPEFNSVCFQGFGEYASGRPFSSDGDLSDVEEEALFDGPVSTAKDKMLYHLNVLSCATFRNAFQLGFELYDCSGKEPIGHSKYLAHLNRRENKSYSFSCRKLIKKPRGSAKFRSAFERFAALEREKSESGIPYPAFETVKDLIWQENENPVSQLEKLQRGLAVLNFPSTGMQRALFLLKGNKCYACDSYFLLSSSGVDIRLPKIDSGSLSSFFYLAGRLFPWFEVDVYSLDFTNSPRLLNSYLARRSFGSSGEIILSSDQDLYLPFRKSSGSQNDLINFAVESFLRNRSERRMMT